MYELIYEIRFPEVDFPGFIPFPRFKVHLDGKMRSNVVSSRAFFQNGKKFREKKALTFSFLLPSSAAKRLDASTSVFPPILSLYYFSSRKNFHCTVFDIFPSLSDPPPPLPPLPTPPTPSPFSCHPHLLRHVGFSFLHRFLGIRIISPDSTPFPRPKLFLPPPTPLKREKQQRHRT